MAKYLYKIFFSTFLFYSCLSFAQINLVPNPSFEQYYSCPSNQGQIYKVKNWKNFGLSPDYFNICAANSSFSVPYSAITYQYAASGNAYSGIYTYDSANTNLREFIGVNLISNLTVGITYYISFKVNSTIDAKSGSNTACNKIGIKLSINSYDSAHLPAIDNFSHIYSAGVITDTLNWTMVSGSFIADSAYAYLTIGNFFDDLNTSAIKFFNNGIDPVGYYFIDDVYLSTTPNSIQELPLSDFFIFPVPSNNILNIFNKVSDIKTIEIFNEYGLRKKVIELTNILTVIELDEFPDGVYYFVFNGSTTRKNEKIIITKNK